MLSKSLSAKNAMSFSQCMKNAFSKAPKRVAVTGAAG